MNPQKKKIFRALPFFVTVTGIIFIVVSFFVRDIPDNPVYEYINDRIARHSWHDIYNSVLAVVFLAILLTTILCIVILNIEKKKSGEKVLRHILASVFSFLFCSAALMFSSIAVTGLWTDDDFSPSYYRFSDNNHTIVIEEKSFMFMGRGTVFQIYDDNSAEIVHTFSTDDGGRNEGNYDIKWHDNYAEITYDTFSGGIKCTDKIIFID